MGLLFKFLTNSNLNRGCRKLNIILNIYLEKQLFFFVYYYLFFFQRLTKRNLKYATNISIVTYRKFILKFCSNFNFNFYSLGNFNKNSLFGKTLFFSFFKFYKVFNSIPNDLAKIHRSYKYEIQRRKKIKYSGIKVSNYKQEISLDLRDFYYNRYFKVGIIAHLSPFFNRGYRNRFFAKFFNFSIFMFRFFKFKVIFSVFFRLRNSYYYKTRFISFIGLNRFRNSFMASKRYIRGVNKIKKLRIYFLKKYSAMSKFVRTISSNSYLKVPTILDFRNDFYFKLRIADKLSLGKNRLFLTSTGRSLFYRFSNILGLPILYRFTKYKNIVRIKKKAKFFQSIVPSLATCKRPVTKLMSATYFKNTKRLRSCNFFIKTPIQKLIFSGKKKSGYNLYNNLFFSMHKVFRRSMLNHVEMLNSIFKRLCIRASIKNIARNNSAMGMRQSCSLLMGYEEIKERINLFFYDFMQSISRKKNRRFRIKKVKDLLFSDIFKCTFKSKRKKRKTHLVRIFREIYDLMFVELNFRLRGTSEATYRSRVLPTRRRRFRKVRINYRIRRRERRTKKFKYFFRLWLKKGGRFSKFKRYIRYIKLKSLLLIRKHKIIFDFIKTIKNFKYNQIKFFSVNRQSCLQINYRLYTYSKNIYNIYYQLKNGNFNKNHNLFSKLISYNLNDFVSNTFQRFFSRHKMRRYFKYYRHQNLNQNYKYIRYATFIFFLRKIGIVKKSLFKKFYLTEKAIKLNKKFKYVKRFKLNKFKFNYNYEALINFRNSRAFITDNKYKDMDIKKKKKFFKSIKFKDPFLILKRIRKKLFKRILYSDFHKHYIVRDFRLVVLQFLFRTFDMTQFKIQNLFLKRQSKSKLTESITSFNKYLKGSIYIYGKNLLKYALPANFSFKNNSIIYKCNIFNKKFLPSFREGKIIHIKDYSDLRNIKVYKKFNYGTGLFLERNFVLRNNKSKLYLKKKIGKLKYRSFKQFLGFGRETFEKKPQRRWISILDSRRVAIKTFLVHKHEVFFKRDSLKDLNKNISSTIINKLILSSFGIFNGLILIVKLFFDCYFNDNIEFNYFKFILYLNKK